MKRFLKYLTVFLLFVVLPLSSCTTYRSKPGSKQDIAGTYELTTITKENENREEYDYKASIGAKAYFSIDTDGRGYYAYKDNSMTDWTCEEVLFSFVADLDDPSLFKAVKMGAGVPTKYIWEKNVGCMDEPTMGFDKKKNTLSYTILHDVLTIYDPDKVVDYQYVCYTKISDTVGLSVINQMTNKQFSFAKPQELKLFNNLYRVFFSDVWIAGYNNTDAEKYEYVIVDMDSFDNNQFDVYYSLKSAPGKKTAKATYSTYIDENNDLRVLKFTVLDTDYYSYPAINGFGSSAYYSYEVVDSNGQTIIPYSNELGFGSEKTVDEYIAEILAE